MRAAAPALVVLAAVGVLGFACGEALAQGQTPGATAPVPPAPSKPDNPPAVMMFLTMVVIAGLVLFAALMPSKRGHQD